MTACNYNNCTLNGEFFSISELNSNSSTPNDSAYSCLQHDGAQVLKIDGFVMFVGYLGGCASLRALGTLFLRCHFRDK